MFPQFPADLVTFTEEILNGKPQFLRSVDSVNIEFDILQFWIKKMCQINLTVY